MRKAMIPVQVRLPVEIVARVDARVAKIRKRRADYTRSDFIRDVLVKLEGAPPAEVSESHPFWEVAAHLSAALPAAERRAFPEDFAEHHDRYRRARRKA